MLGSQTIGELSPSLCRLRERLLLGRCFMQLIRGAEVAEKVLTECKRDIAELSAQGRRPGLAVVLVGDDPASRAYIRSKDKKCRELGVHSVKHELAASTTQAELQSLIAQLNADPAIHGILVQ